MQDKKPSPETPENKIKKETKETEKKQLPEEFGGTNGPEPTRYGDWENGGRCTDF